MSLKKIEKLNFYWSLYDIFFIFTLTVTAIQALSDDKYFLILRIGFHTKIKTVSFEISIL